MIFSAIKNFFSLIPMLWKIVKIVFFAVLLWIIFSYLNNKFGILKPFISILKAVFKGIRSVFSMIGL